MSNNRQIKEAVVADLKEKFDKASSCVLLNYIGLNVEEVTALRSQFRAVDVEYHVLKNSMIRLAASELGIQGLDGYLEGPTAVAFSFDDPTAGSRVINGFIQKTKKTELKCAILDNKVLDAKSAEALGNLPTKEILLAQLLNVMNAPVRGFAVALGAVRDKMSDAQQA